MKIIVALILLADAIYSLAAVWVPGIRIVYWKGSAKKFGGLSYLGAAMFTGPAALLMLGLLPEPYGIAMFWTMIVGFILMFVGSLRDRV